MTVDPGKWPWILYSVIVDQTMMTKWPLICLWSENDQRTVPNVFWRKETEETFRIAEQKPEYSNDRKFLKSEWRAGNDVAAVTKSSENSKGNINPGKKGALTMVQREEPNTTMAISRRIPIVFWWFLYHTDHLLTTKTMAFSVCSYDT